MAARKKAAEDSVQAIEESRFAKVLAGEVAGQITKKYGGSALFRATDNKNSTMFRIPSGIFLLDAALGGGWPVGRINIAYGHKSSSKTTTLLRTLGRAQRLCATCYTGQVITDDGEITADCVCGKYREMVCAFIDVEGAWDVEWAKKVGVQPDRILLSSPEYAEESLDICEALIRSAEVDVIVLDSIAFLTPSKEIEKSMEEFTVGEQARLVGKGIRKITSAITTVKNEHGRMPTMFFTNQIRMKVGGYGNPETVSGGLAAGFAASTEVKFHSGKYEIDEKTSQPIHADMHFKIEKNKTYKARIEGDYRLILSDTEIKKIGDVYDENKIVEHAQRVGLIEGHGSSWTCFGEKFPGKSPIERRLAQDPMFKRKLSDALMKVMLTG